MDEKTLLRLARQHGTPLVVVDHKVLRENYTGSANTCPACRCILNQETAVATAATESHREARLREA